MPKSLIVLGGSAGIGKACVLYFLDKGWNVCFSYNTNNKEAQAICERYDNAVCVHVDCTDSASVRNLSQACIDRFGSIDSVIASAGISRWNQIQDITDDEVKQVFDINFFGTFYLFRDVSSYLIGKKSGSLIAISSVFAQKGGSCESHYSASKAAIEGLVTSLSQELISSNITVNAIAPGIVDTSMNDMHDKDELKKLTPLNRLCNPAEVATTAYFLSSDGAKYITGQIVRQDGAVNF